MRKLFIFFSIAACILSGCSGSPMATGTPQNPPFPTTQSILPLGIGNSWTYSLTAYDTLGNKIVPSSVTLALRIPGGFGLVGDTTLIALSWQNYNQTFDGFVYKFEWDALDSGPLVIHRGSYPLGSRGLYVIGWYRRSETHLFASERLWLAYPADSGKTWTFFPDSVGDSLGAASMEILSTHAGCFAPDAQTMTAGAFVGCYLYKETGADYVSYFYYNPDIGCVRYLRYSNGRLSESYYLKQFSE